MPSQCLGEASGLPGTLLKGFNNIIMLEDRLRKVPSQRLGDSNMSRCVESKLIDLLRL